MATTPSESRQETSDSQTKTSDDAGDKRRPNYKVKCYLAGHTRSVAALKFSNDGLFLGSAGADKIAKTWSVKDGKFERVSCLQLRPTPLQRRVTISVFSRLLAISLASTISLGLRMENFS